MDQAVIGPDGSITVPGGVTYHRTEEGVDRRRGGDYIDEGALVLTYAYSQGMVLSEGEDARRVWAEIAPTLGTGRRSKRQRRQDMSWVGHVFVSESGLVLLCLDGEC